MSHPAATIRGMNGRRLRYRVSATTSEWIVASAVVAVSIVVAALGIWVFRPARVTPGDSTANVILLDRATLGFVRLLVIVAVVYGLASIAVLVTRGRWLHSIYNGNRGRGSVGLRPNDHRAETEPEPRSRGAGRGEPIVVEFLHG